ncbi:WD repeat-containing protein 18 [Durusdinium trenchii]|uniref:WD repeat-containing protein 18 n=1 Tax=Durusdinium trenchii TaxID=1381693 RepID=A0ABP0IR73_9DINO
MDDVVVVAALGSGRSAGKPQGAGSNRAGPPAPLHEQQGGDAAGIGVFSLRGAATTVTAFKDSAGVRHGVTTFGARRTGRNGRAGDHVLVVQDKKNALRVWAWRKEQPVMTCTCPEKLGPVASSQCGGFVASGGESGSCYLWDTSSGTLVRSWKSHYRAVSSVLFADDDATLLTAGQDGILHAWDLGDLLDEAARGAVRPVFTFSEHTLAITQVWAGHFGSGMRVVTCSADSTIKLWQLDPAQPSKVRSLESVVLPSALECVVADGLELWAFAGATDGNIYQCMLRAAETAETAQRASATQATSARSRMRVAVLEGHRATVTCVGLSGSNALLVSGSLDGTCRIWDTISRQAIKVVRLNEASRPVVALTVVPMPAELARGRGGAASALRKSAEKHATIPPLKPFLRYQSSGAPAPEGVQLRGQDHYPVSQGTFEYAPAITVAASGAMVATAMPIPNGSSDSTSSSGPGSGKKRTAQHLDEDDQGRVHKLDREVVQWKSASAKLFTLAVENFLA